LLVFSTPNFGYHPPKKELLGDSLLTCVFATKNPSVLCCSKIKYGKLSDSEGDFQEISLHRKKAKMGQTRFGFLHPNEIA
jgi:hypothetical protein